jgi:hypothetical protein
MQNPTVRSLIVAVALSVAAGPTALAVKKGPAGSATPMSAKQALERIASDPLAGGALVGEALAAGVVSGTATERAQVAERLWEAARASGQDAAEFHGGVPLPHTRLQIDALQALGALPEAAATPVVRRLLDEWLREWETLSAERRRASPLQALQAPWGLLLGGLVEGAGWDLAARFVDSPAVEEYAKDDVALELFGRRLASARSPAEAARTAVESFRTADLVEVRQGGRRVTRAAELLVPRLTKHLSALAPYLASDGEPTAQSYFAAAVVSTALAAKAARGEALTAGDRALLDRSAGVARRVRESVGEGRYGALPLEKALREAGVPQ